MAKSADTTIPPAASTANKPPTSLRQAVDEFIEQARSVRLGGGEKGIERQHRHGRLTARERIDRLIDTGSDQFECMLFAAWNMYSEYGGAPSAGVVTTVA